MVPVKPGFFEALALRVGSLPARRVTWALVILFSAWVLLDVLVLQITSGMARSISFERSLAASRAVSAMMRLPV